MSRHIIAAMVVKDKKEQCKHFKNLSSYFFLMDFVVKKVNKHKFEMGVFLSNLKID